MNKAEIKDNVLTENTAQSVYNHLQTLLKTPDSIYRWIWELLQNARDASKGANTLTASINYRPGELVFLHNGRGFKEEEIGHLIFHGSTKTEDEGKIGQYGSGFLTTHLLSWAIDVSGQLDDGRWFDFCLERKPDSEGALRESMDEAWNNFNPSSSPIHNDDFATDDGFTTRFAYPIRTEEAQTAVKEGISMLKECAPFVVVFNPEFSGININIDTTDYSDELCFKVLERSPLDASGIEQITVAESNSEVRKYLLAKGDEVSVTVLNSDDSECLSVEAIPRLFLGFPLVGTKSFSFPAVINSFKFSATPDREGVWLAKDGDEATIENRNIIEEACVLLIDLVKYAVSSGWHHIHQWVKVSPIENPNWLDANWLRTCIGENLIEEIRKTPIILNTDDSPINPEQVKLPFAGSQTSIETLWDLFEDIKGQCEFLPKREETMGWCNTIKSWADVYQDEPVSLFNEVKDGPELASFIEKSTRQGKKYGRIEDLQDLLRDEISAVEWLNRLHGFFNENELDEAVLDYHIVIDQAGFLDTLPVLHRDAGIDDNLKDIAELLEWSIRVNLRDIRLTSLSEKEGSGDMDNNEVVDTLCQKLRDRADENPDEDFQEASARLFAWIVGQENWNNLRGFPVFAKDSKSDSPILDLPTAHSGELPLAPVGAWDEDLQQFSELFPPDRILADVFFEKVSSPETWKQLDEQGFIRWDMIIQRAVTDLKLLSPEVSEDKQDHKTAEPIIGVTDFVERVAIMDWVRNTRKRAYLFWRFLTEWLIKADNQYLEVRTAKCNSCEDDISHEYHMAAWLEPVRNNLWIHNDKDKQRFKPNARELARLLRNYGWKLNSLDENPDAAKLLEAIGVTPSDLRLEFMADDEEKRDILINTAATLHDRPQLVHHIQANENLPANLEKIVTVTGGDLSQVVEDAEKRQKQQRTVDENRELGKKVEKWVGESLDEKGFNVTPVDIGADFEIDMTTLDVTQGEQKWWIEVKSARTQSVKMSSKQTQNALDKGEDFLLCVVPISENGPLNPEVVKSNMRFIKNIREKLGDRVALLCESIEDQEIVHTELPDDTSSGVDLDFEAGKAEIHVKNSVWEDEDEAFPLKNLAENLK